MIQYTLLFNHIGNRTAIDKQQSGTCSALYILNEEDL